MSLYLTPAILNLASADVDLKIITMLMVVSLPCDKMHPAICSTKMQFHSMQERGSKMYDSHRKFQGNITQCDTAIALCP